MQSQVGLSPNVVTITPLQFRTNLPKLFYRVRLTFFESSLFPFFDSVPPIIYGVPTFSFSKCTKAATRDSTPARVLGRVG